MNRIIGLRAIAVIGLLMFGGCGGGGGGTPPPPDTVEAPTFDLAPGTYRGTRNVELSTTTPGATIRFTTGGAPPTSTSGTQYSGPIQLIAPTTVRAIAYLAGWNDSPVSEAAYVINHTVNAATGSDSAGDGVTIPYKTIGKGLLNAAAGDNVTVAPGTYDNVLGETFPIVIPPGVRLIGDEANKGAGAAPTLIRGGGGLPSNPGFLTIAVYPADNSSISGFRVYNNSHLGLFKGALAVNDNGVTVANNRIVDTHAIAIYSDVPGTGRIISGNVLQNNFWGIIFTEGSGAGARVEYNVITQNVVGVEYDAPATDGDLGGGTTGSAGGNVIAGNSDADLYTTFASGSTIDAANNFWDSYPPVSGPYGSGIDIYNPNGATIVWDGGATAP